MLGSSEEHPQHTHTYPLNQQEAITNYKYHQMKLHNKKWVGSGKARRPEYAEK